MRTPLAGALLIAAQPGAASDPGEGRVAGVRPPVAPRERQRAAAPPRAAGAVRAARACAGAALVGHEGRARFVDLVGRVRRGGAVLHALACATVAGRVWHRRGSVRGPRTA